MSENDVAQRDKPIIAMTMGDPCGIGPEVIASSLAGDELFSICRPVVIGNLRSMEQALKVTGTSLGVQEIQSPREAGGSPGVIDILDIRNLDPADVRIGEVSPACGKAAMEWVIKAAELAIDGQVQALATAPINKEAASQAGYKSIGHMELLQEVSGASEVATMLISGALRVVHLTTHRSLRQACDYVTKAGVLAKLELTQSSFAKWGMPQPRIGVAALNPHASDGGLLGAEERDEIAPAIEEAQAKGIDAHGPVPADIVFHQAIEGAYHVVLAMYHDQGHIPIKVYGFEQSISANLGLPFVRTSVDHGTAFDIAGKGIANYESMVEAVKLAASIVSGKGLTHLN